MNQTREWKKKCVYGHMILATQTNKVCEYLLKYMRYFTMDYQ